MSIENFKALLVSYHRTFEHKATEELKEFLEKRYNYEMNIKQLSYTSLLLVKTIENPEEILRKLDKKLKKNPYYFQSLLKFVPLEFHVETSLENIEHVIIKKYKDKIKDHTKWRIKLRRRDTDLEREELIEKVALHINNGEVDLEDPDFIIRIEILGDDTYLSFSSISDVSVETYQEEEKIDTAVQNY
jgi:tRNA(Ser,Leu) C12 N-acetylase TAN1